MAINIRKYVTRTISTITMASILLATFHSIFPIRHFEDSSYDLLVRLTLPNRKFDNNIKLILIDDNTIKDFDQNFSLTWPFPRSIYGEVIQYLSNAGAKGIALDLEFSESHADYPEQDHIFAKAIKDASIPVIVATYFSKKRGNNSIVPISQEFHKIEGLIDAQKASLLPHYNYYIPPLRSLTEAGAEIASVMVAPDQDGTYRHYPPGVFYDKQFIWSLPIQLALSTNSFSNDSLAGMQNNVGLFTINYKGTPSVDGLRVPYERYPLGLIARKAMNMETEDSRKILPSVFTNSLVIISFNSSGQIDLRPSPINHASRGAEIHAIALDNFLHREFNYELPLIGNLFLTFFWILTLTVLMLRYSNIIALSLIFGVAIVIQFLSFYVALNSFNMWIPLVSPAAAALFTTLISAGQLYYIEKQHSRFIRETFQHYVSPAVVDELIRSNQRPQLGGQIRELTIFFSDIAGFTTIAESLNPSDLVSLLNRYLGEITSILLNYEGTFDKYIGDAVVAFWNAPLDIPDHPIKAVSAAITAMEKIDLLQPYFEEKYKTRLNTRVGIATGEVVVGNFGAEGRKVVNYSIMGDSANFAARLEGANKHFGTQILVSAEVYNRSRDSIRYRRIGLLRVVGKHNEICIYEPLQRSVYKDYPDQLELFHTAQAEFESGRFHEATQIFASISVADPLIEKYLARIKKESPGENWSPGWHLTEK